MVADDDGERMQSGRKGDRASRSRYLADAKSWADIATGALAPLDAFGLGKLRVRGRLEFAD